MKKDAYYFPHFSNARNDSKLIKLRRVMGIEGYGMYFLILEVLREQTEFKLPITILEDLAFEWHTSKEKLHAVVCNFDLFDIDNSMFISPKLVLYLQPYIEKSERARVAANKRWNKIKGIDANADANALHEQCDSNASKVKERKGKERKIKEDKLAFQNALIPFLDKYSKEMIREFFDYWTEHGELDIKMRFQKEKSFGIGRRLSTWHKRSKEFKNNTSKFTNKPTQGGLAI